MKNKLYFIFLCSALAANISLGQTVPQKGLKSITPQEMEAHVKYLASDEMMGRDTPSPELEICASYIAAEFTSYGLTPADPDNQYFQFFNLLKTRLGEKNTFSMTAAGLEKDFRIKYDFIPNHATGNGSLNNVPVVFAGYGITAPEYNYDDYANIEAKGKVVIIFKNEPQKDDTSSVFDGRKSTDHAKLRLKIDNALDHGAVGIIFVPDPKTAFRKPPNNWPSLLRRPPQDGVPVMLEEKKTNKLICITIGKNASSKLFAASGKTLQNLFSEIDKSLIPQSFDLAETSVTIETNLAGDKVQVKNVVGFWEGSDPILKNELIIIGGHYDHIGATNDSTIYNGADDNASGTAGVMEIAEAFTSCDSRPKRSLLFMAYAGEEKGLFGSKFYTAHPIFPLKNTVAMLNLDMISRNDTNEVAIIGALTSKTLRKVNEEANALVGMDLGYDQEQYFKQSDHYSFYRKNIPVLFYNCRDTPDLHQPTDTMDKIIPEKMARIGRLVFSTAWLLAEMDGRPDFIKFR